MKKTTCKTKWDCDQCSATATTEKPKAPKGWQELELKVIKVNGNMPEYLGDHTVQLCDNCAYVTLKYTYDDAKVVIDKKKATNWLAGLFKDWGVK